MTDVPTTEVFGPIDYLLLEFSAEKINGDAAVALLDLVERDIVRIYDLIVIRKDPDGSFIGVDLTDLADDSLGGFAAFAGARSGLLGDDDIADAAAIMDPGTSAALFVYENSWAIPFVRAAQQADAQVIASARIPAAAVLDVLDQLDAAAAAN